MAYLTKIEAAIRLGTGMELLDHCCVQCPKPYQDRILKVVAMPDGDVIDEQELKNFHAYLHSPWPTTEKSNRPHLPEIVKQDIREECHQACAICGLMNSGEIAHIESVASSKNNGPDNLIFLCPNHHTQYDFGFLPSNNVSKTEVSAAKEMKSELTPLGNSAVCAATYRFGLKVERSRKGVCAELSSSPIAHSSNARDPQCPGAHRLNETQRAQEG